MSSPSEGFEVALQRLRDAMAAVGVAIVAAVRRQPKWRLALVVALYVAAAWLLGWVTGR